jgi:hypothetical protein
MGAAVLFAFSGACLLHGEQPAQESARTDQAKDAAAAKISDLAWIVGAWRTTLGDDVLEETWNEPVGNQMLGMFQWQKEGKVWLNELVSITQGDDGKIAFRLRHFGPDMTAWEDKDKAAALSAAQREPGAAVFENPQRDEPRRFIYMQPAKDMLVVRIEGYKNGELSKTEYTFTRRTR